MKKIKQSRGDQEKIKFLKREYHYLLFQKFELLEQIDMLLLQRKPFAHLHYACQKLTTELQRIDGLKQDILLGII